jgi:hypothetical protein
MVVKKKVRSQVSGVRSQVSGKPKLYPHWIFLRTET